MNEKSEKLELKKEIGARMKEFRKQMRFTQHEMAPYCGVGRADLSRIEKGEVFPGIFLLVKLSKEFKLSLPWVLLNEGEMLIPNAESINKKSCVMIQGEELHNLFFYIEKIPLLRHRMLALFYELKGNFQDLFEAETTRAQQPAPSEPAINNYK